MRTCVIFLDVDGVIALLFRFVETSIIIIPSRVIVQVLNVRTRSGRDFTDLRPELIANLRELMARTGAKIVLSTR